jgi:hypothetical protein
MLPERVSGTKRKMGRGVALSGFARIRPLADLPFPKNACQRQYSNEKTSILKTTFDWLEETQHAGPHAILITWLGYYYGKSPGLRPPGDNGTVCLDDPFHCSLTSE